MIWASPRLVGDAETPTRRDRSPRSLAPARPFRRRRHKPSSDSGHIGALAARHGVSAAKEGRSPHRPPNPRRPRFTFSLIWASPRLVGDAEIPTRRDRSPRSLAPARPFRRRRQNTPTGSGHIGAATACHGVSAAKEGRSPHRPPNPKRPRFTFSLIWASPRLVGDAEIPTRRDRSPRSLASARSFRRRRQKTAARLELARRNP